MERFLPFVPQQGDDEGAAIIEEDLQWLLAADAQEFWAVLRDDGSLAMLLDTFLRYARRPFEEEFANLSATELSMWSLMLALLHRMLCAREPGAPVSRDRAALLSGVLTVPALLDVCALYGAGGGRALEEVMAAALVLQPRLASELSRAAGTITDNLAQVVSACQGAVAGAAARDPGAMRSLRDGAVYLRDTCLTLCALLRAAPGAALPLLSGGPGLVEALGVVHDGLLPAVAAALAPMPAAAPLLGLCRQVGLGAERLAQLLLLHAYLDERTAAAADEGGSGSSSSSSSSRGGGPSAVAAGEALLHAVMAMGHREEEGASAGSSDLGLAPALAERFGLGGSIEAALHAGLLSLDEAQLDYLAALLGLGSLAAAPAPVPGGQLADGAEGEGGNDGGASTEDDAMLQSRIQQVRDLLPDYGPGYVAACLDALGGSPERVLDALLEGSPPPAVAGLDQGLSLQAYQQQRQAAAAKGKGKAGAGDKGKRPAGQPAPSSTSLAGRMLSAAAAAWPEERPSGAGGPGAAAAKRQEPKIESRTAKYLDLREESYRESLLSTATAMQYEYEDEYDDSFDDLITFGGGGDAEAEGGESRGGGSTAGAAAAVRGMAGLSLEQQQQVPRAPQQQRSGGAQAQGGRGRGRGPLPKSRLWVLDGRIYNYRKEGAVEVGSQAEADKVLAAAQEATREIMGLGPGGNVPLPPHQQREQQQHGEETEGAPAPSGSGGRGGGRGRGGPPGGGEGGGGRGRGRHPAHTAAHRQHQTHHRRERALAKQARAAW